MEKEKPYQISVFALYSSVNIKFKIKQNLAMALEVNIVVTLGPNL